MKYGMPIFLPMIVYHINDRLSTIVILHLEVHIMAKSKKKKRKYPKPWEPPTEWEVPEIDLDSIFSIKNALLTGSEFIEKYALASGREYLQEHPNSLRAKDAYRLNDKYAQNLRRVNPYQIKYDTANIIDYRKYKYAKDNKDIVTVAEEYFQKHKDDPLRCIAPYFSEAIIYSSLLT